MAQNGSSYYGHRSSQSYGHSSTFPQTTVGYGQGPHPSNAPVQNGYTLKDGYRSGQGAYDSNSHPQQPGYDYQPVASTSYAPASTQRAHSYQPTSSFPQRATSPMPPSTSNGYSASTPTSSFPSYRSVSPLPPQQPPLRSPFIPTSSFPQLAQPQHSNSDQPILQSHPSSAAANPYNTQPQQAGYFPPSPTKTQPAGLSSPPQSPPARSPGATNGRPLPTPKARPLSMPPSRASSSIGVASPQSTSPERTSHEHPPIPPTMGELQKPISPPATPPTQPTSPVSAGRRPLPNPGERPSSFRAQKSFSVDLNAGSRMTSGSSVLSKDSGSTLPPVEEAPTPGTKFVPYWRRNTGSETSSTASTSSHLNRRSVDLSALSRSSISQENVTAPTKDSIPGASTNTSGRPLPSSPIKSSDVGSPVGQPSTSRWASSPRSTTSQSIELPPLPKPPTSSNGDSSERSPAWRQPNLPNLPRPRTTAPTESRQFPSSRSDSSTKEPTRPTHGKTQSLVMQFAALNTNPAEPSPRSPVKSTSAFASSSAQREKESITTSPSWPSTLPKLPQRPQTSAGHRSAPYDERPEISTRTQPTGQTSPTRRPLPPSSAPPAQPPAQKPPTMPTWRRPASSSAGVTASRPRAEEEQPPPPPPKSPQQQPPPLPPRSRNTPISSVSSPKQDVMPSPVPQIMLPDDPSPVPQINLPRESPGIPRINLPDDPPLSSSGRPGGNSNIPAISLPDDHPSVPSISLPGDDDGMPQISISSDSGPQISISVDEGAATRQQRAPLPPLQRPPPGALICAGCRGSIVGRIVNATGCRWHPGCFKCCVCGEMLEHVSSYEHEGRPYCHLDYHEIFAPRCHHCKTPIIEERFITLDDEALGKRTYHEQHFFCAECGDPFLPPSRPRPAGAPALTLSGDGAFEDDNVGFTVYRGHPYCEACHVRLRLPKCKKCKKPIREGTRAVEAMGGKWCWECFTCASCDQPFDDPAFFERDGKPFCESCFSIMIRNEL